MRSDVGVERGSWRSERWGRAHGFFVFALAADVQHRAERAAQAGAGLICGSDECRVARGTAKVACGSCTEQQRSTRLANELARSSGDHLVIRRDSLGLPLGGGGFELAAIGLMIEHQHQQLRTRCAIDSGVMNLGENSEPILGQTLDDVGLPQRTAAVEWAAHDARDELADLMIVAWRWNCGVTHMKVEIEVWVLDPKRMVETEGHFANAAPQWFEQMQTLSNLFAPLAEWVVVGLI